MIEKEAQVAEKPPLEEEKGAEFDGKVAKEENNEEQKRPELPRKKKLRNLSARARARVCGYVLCVSLFSSRAFSRAPPSQPFPPHLPRSRVGILRTSRRSAAGRRKEHELPLRSSFAGPRRPPRPPGPVRTRQPEQQRSILPGAASGAPRHRARARAPGPGPGLNSIVSHVSLGAWMVSACGAHRQSRCQDLCSA